MGKVWGKKKYKRQAAMPMCFFLVRAGYCFCSAAAEYAANRCRSDRFPNAIFDNADRQTLSDNQDQVVLSQPTWGNLVIIFFFFGKPGGTSQRVELTMFVGGRSIKFSFTFLFLFFFLNLFSYFIELISADTK